LYLALEGWKQAHAGRPTPARRAEALEDRPDAGDGAQDVGQRLEKAPRRDAGDARQDVLEERVERGEKVEVVGGLPGGEPGDDGCEHGASLPAERRAGHGLRVRVEGRSCAAAQAAGELRVALR
jgi:hypothetical protein